MLPFSPPHIYQEIIDEVVDSLKSGWITTGPKTKQFEKDLASFTCAPQVLCLNSATAGLEIMLRWIGVQEGDEVIVPAYTYSATANVVIHCGATPVMVDTNNHDFNISIHAVKEAITARTKVIMPVDIGGYPCDYNELISIVQNADVIKLFSPRTPEQEKLGRIMILSDAAHSIGARYDHKRTGQVCDATVFSFHAVKNLTTAEGGAVALNLPSPFDNEAVYKSLCIKALHGQNKDALAKMQKGSWEYDIVEPGYKFNMPDILAAIGLVELRHYERSTLPRRQKIVEQYDAAFTHYGWAERPVFKKDIKESSYHLYMLRIKNITEQQRNAIISKIFEKDISVNVHFKPLPLLSYYKNNGYKIENYPTAYDNYSREISLPVYFDLTDEQVQTVINAIVESYKEVIG